MGCAAAGSARATPAGAPHFRGPRGRAERGLGGSPGLVHLRLHRPHGIRRRIRAISWPAPTRVINIRAPSPCRGQSATPRGVLEVRGAAARAAEERGAQKSACTRRARAGARAPRRPGHGAACNAAPPTDPLGPRNLAGGTEAGRAKLRGPRVVGSWQVPGEGGSPLGMTVRKASSRGGWSGPGKAQVFAARTRSRQAGTSGQEGGSLQGK